MIPQQIRRELGIKPKTKLVIYSRGGRLVASKLEAPELGGELRALFGEVDERYKNRKKPTEREILAEIQEYRKEKRTI